MHRACPHGDRDEQGQFVPAEADVRHTFCHVFCHAPSVSAAQLPAAYAARVSRFMNADMRWRRSSLRALASVVM